MLLAKMQKMLNKCHFEGKWQQIGQSGTPFRNLMRLSLVKPCPTILWKVKSHFSYL